jgi:shikimate kinase
VRYAGLQLHAELDQQHHHRQQQLQQQQQHEQQRCIVPSIILIGMRGSGKTCIGLALARSTSRDFFDCDECMQRQLVPGGTLGGFIEEKGWAAFRREEVRVLGAILRGEGGGAATWSCGRQPAACPVISTGGGIVETPEVMRNACCVACDV